MPRTRNRSRSAKPARPAPAADRLPTHVLQPMAFVVLTLIVAAIMFNGELRIAGVPGGALDDSWIHYTIAENLATGHGWAFNKGHLTAV